MTVSASAILSLQRCGKKLPVMPEVRISSLTNSSFILLMSIYANMPHYCWVTDISWANGYLTRNKLEQQRINWQKLRQHFYWRWNTILLSNRLKPSSNNYRTFHRLHLNTTNCWINIKSSSQSKENCPAKGGTPIFPYESILSLLLFGERYPWDNLVISTRKRGFAQEFLSLKMHQKNMDIIAVR